MALVHQRLFDGEWDDTAMPFLKLQLNRKKEGGSRLNKQFNVGSPLPAEHSVQLATSTGHDT
jgi:hypothetical protein